MPAAREKPLVDLVPLWRIVAEAGVVALITPALDYVGALELSPADLRFATAERLTAFGEALRALVSSVEDECSLLFLYRVDEDSEAECAAYEAGCAAPAGSALHAYVAQRAGWLRAQRLRRVRLFLFFSLRGGAANALTRGYAGMPLLYRDVTAHAHATHAKALEALACFRDRLAGRLAQVGLPSRELTAEALRGLHFELLNPTAAREHLQPPAVTVRDTLWHEEEVAQRGAHLREYTEAEQLAHESLQDEGPAGYFRHGQVFRRVCTLKTLPEGGTAHGLGEHLLYLSARTPAGELLFPHTLAVAVNVLPQGRTRFRLDKRHGLVDALSRALPFLQGTSIQKRVADSAAQGSIEGLFAELETMSSKIVDVSVSVLLEGATVEQLDARTEGARAAFNRLGNAQLHTETYGQLAAFFSLFPGPGPYQVRRKACTSRNAADFLPVYGGWAGTREAVSRAFAL